MPERQYRGWAGEQDLPELDKAAPAWRDFAYRAPDSVTRTWLQRGAAGLELLMNIIAMLLVLIGTGLYRIYVEHVGPIPLEMLSDDAREVREGVQSLSLMMLLRAFSSGAETSSWARGSRPRGSRVEPRRSIRFSTPPV